MLENPLKVYSLRVDSLSVYSKKARMVVVNNHHSGNTLHTSWLLTAAKQSRQKCPSAAQAMPSGYKIAAFRLNAIWGATKLSS